MAKGRKTGGRQKGTPNKATIEVQARCRELIESPTYVEYFKHRLEVGQLPPALEALAWHYAYGKPTERVEMTGAEGGDLVIRWKS